MSKNLEISVLLDLYGQLLTKKQFDMLDFYYNDDLSLAEIAEQYHISRQGVHDSIKRGEELLLSYENVLHLSENEKIYQDVLVEFKAQALDILNECRKVSFGKNIADKTIILLENLDSKLAEFDNSELLGE
ncbi:MAG: putative DNA-binding protein [Ruminococcus sp.]|nr:putative DNA-binding protein [Ruminococcus sp.]